VLDQIVPPFTQAPDNLSSTGKVESYHQLQLGGSVGVGAGVVWALSPAEVSPAGVDVDVGAGVMLSLSSARVAPDVEVEGWGGLVGDEVEGAAVPLSPAGVASGVGAEVWWAVAVVGDEFDGVEELLLLPSASAEVTSDVGAGVWVWGALVGPEVEAATVPVSPGVSWGAAASVGAGVWGALVGDEIVAWRACVGSVVGTFVGAELWGALVGELVG